MLPEPMYDLDGKQYTIYDLIHDELRAAYGLDRLLRLPEPIPTEEIFRSRPLRERILWHVADWVYALAHRVSNRIDDYRSGDDREDG
jgi:hypothetical protein